MSSLKILAAVAAAATVSLAFAQGTPPQPASDPAVGAGQRSTQATPMGATGTPGSGGAAAQGSTAGSSAGAAGTTSSMPANSGSSMSGSSSDTGSTMSSSTSGSGTRPARADRN